MRVKKFTFCEYRIPFRTPIRTARGNLTTRRGFLVAAHGRNGEVGVGEVAVLPEFGTEGVHEAGRLLTQLADYYRDQEVPEACDDFPLWRSQVELSDETAPATVYGVECALLGLSRAYEHPTLSPGDTVFGVSEPFQVNSQISGSNVDELVLAAKQRWDVGFRTLKLKVGILSPEEEIRAIKMIRVALPDVKLRLDANCAWTDFQAIDFCEQIRSVGIEYIEDPAKSWSLHTYMQFDERCSIKRASDEFLDWHQNSKDEFEWLYFKVIVLKPVRTGSISRLKKQVALARKHFQKVIFTTMYDTSLGLACTMYVMKDIADHTIAHGLDTSRLLASDTLIHHLLPDHGKLRVLDLIALPDMIREPYRKLLELPA